MGYKKDRLAFSMNRQFSEMCILPDAMSSGVEEIVQWLSGSGRDLEVMGSTPA